MNASSVLINPLALFKFQKQLLDEEIFLDIERARCMRLFEDSRHTRQIDAPRIQIWRESRCDKTAFDDNMSHYTAGTMLSGPMKDRVAPIMSRLVVYLGRSEEYMTVFSTYTCITYAYFVAICDWFTDTNLLSNG
jgi:hypothetical protein